MGNGGAKDSPKGSARKSTQTNTSSSPPSTPVAPSKQPSSTQVTTPSKSNTTSASSTPTKTPAPAKEDLSVFSQQRLSALFDKYKSAEDDQIGPSELEKFCEDIGVDPDDAIMVVIAYHCGCKEMGYISSEEFTNGFTKLQCDTIDKIKAQVPKFKEELHQPAKFQPIYRFAFQFAKEQEQKCIGIEIAQGLLTLLLVDRYPIAKSFIEFLKQQDQYKVINGDQWSSLLEFCKAIQPDFSNYDENGAWPCILDEWVSWVKEKKSDD
eukprot:TRINITY_DN1869_c0_g1_i1.p1 TRINITY_DN1869_c0_g1~~TRINITY_DN1869_c0_g1_i1.p1  ORF type:complete len:266 (+),score=60.10 TRINITY_DN1869_c0_g1_i1:154-951(+)